MSKSAHIFFDSLDYHKSLFELSEVDLGHPYTHSLVALEWNSLPLWGDNLPLSLGVGFDNIAVRFKLGDVLDAPKIGRASNTEQC